VYKAAKPICRAYASLVEPLFALCVRTSTPEFSFFLLKQRVVVKVMYFCKEPGALEHQTSSSLSAKRLFEK